MAVMPAIPLGADNDMSGQLVLDAVLLLEALHTAHGVDDSLLAGVERMTGAADLDTDLRLAGAAREYVATQAGYLGFLVVLGMNLWLHGYTLTFF
jgi:hypothetical protein